MPRQRLALLLALLAAPMIVVLGAMLAGRYYYASPLYEPVAENPAPVVAPQPTVRATGSAPPNDATVPEETTALEETTVLEETTAFQAPEGTKASSTARVVCLRAAQGASSPPPESTEALNYYKTLNSHFLTRVLTPKVAAHPDGVHIQIDNRLGKHVGYETAPEYVQGTIPGDKGLPEGKSIQVAFSPPGTAKIACETAWSAVNNYAYFEVVKGDSDYKSPELECKPGAQIAGGGVPTDTVMPREVPKGQKFHPVEHVREEYSGKLKEGDVVEAAGYTEGPYPHWGELCGWCVTGRSWRRIRTLRADATREICTVRASFSRTSEKAVRAKF